MASLLFAGSFVFLYWPQIEALFAAKQQQETSNVDTKQPVIDGAVLLERYESAQQFQPTPEEIAEEKAFELEQIAQARIWLLDLNPEQRIAGLEQLSAYPTRAAEKLMVEQLLKDESEAVRAAAAVSLSYIEQPSSLSLDALNHALHDINEDVRNSALNTLQSFVTSLEDDKSTVKRIVTLLEKQAKSKQLPADTRLAIKGYLEDQFGN